MSRWKWRIAALGLVLAAISLSLRACGYESFGEYNFRLKIEVDTPEGVRTGSGVMSVSYSRGPNLQGGATAVARFRGEAVFVDLGNGRNVVALLAHGRNGEDGNSIKWLPVTALTGAPWGWGSTQALEALKASGKRLEGRMELKPPLIPTLVTFADVSDPRTATTLDTSHFRFRFGQGYVFKRAMIEIAPSGIWPFSLLPISWPRWLFGEAVTHEIKSRLPLLKAPGRPTQIVLQSAGVSVGAFAGSEQAFWRN